MSIVHIVHTLQKQRNSHNFEVCVIHHSLPFRATHNFEIFLNIYNYFNVFKI